MCSARRLGVSWSVQDGSLVVRPLGEAIPGEMFEADVLDLLKLAPA